MHIPEKHKLENNWTDSSIEKLNQIFYLALSDDEKAPLIFEPKNKKLVIAAWCIDQ